METGKRRYTLSLYYVYICIYIRCRGQVRGTLSQREIPLAMHFQHRHRGNTRGNVSPSLFLDWCIRVYSRRYFARGGLGGRHCRQDTVPAPRILQGPFRNVDPHTTSLAVYFRGPASELFNMLNPESPGAISVLARTCIYIYTHLCILSEPHPASVCVCVCTRRETTYARLYVEAIYIYILRGRSWDTYVPSAGTPRYMSAQSVTF